MVWFLDILKEDLATSLVLQLLSGSQHVSSPHEIGEENIWQSSSKPEHCSQNSKTWTDRGRKHRAPGWSDGWWQPQVLVVVLGHLQGGCSSHDGQLKMGGWGQAALRCSSGGGGPWGSLRMLWGGGRRMNLGSWLEWGVKCWVPFKYCWGRKPQKLLAKTVWIIFSASHHSRKI